MPITVDHSKSLTVADWTGTVTVGNSSGGSTTMLATDMVRPSDWNADHSVTFTPAASEIASLFNFGNGLTSSTSTNGITVGVREVNFYEPFLLPNTNSTLSAPGIGTWYFEPFSMPFNIEGGAFNMFVSNADGFLQGAAFSASTGSASKVATQFNRLAIYGRGAGANSTRLESLWTGNCDIFGTQSITLATTTTGSMTITNALTLSYPTAVGANGVATYGTTSQSGSTSSATSTFASTFANNLISTARAYVTGGRMDVIGFSGLTLTPGQYWLAHMCSTSSQTSGTRYTAGTCFGVMSVLGVLENALAGFKQIGSSVSSTNSNPIPFKGYLATTTLNATSAAANADLRYVTGKMYWNYDGQAFP